MLILRQTGCCQQSFGAGIEPFPACGDLVCYRLAQFHTPLVERINIKQHCRSEHTVFVERDQSAERCRIKIIDKDRCRRPIARIMPRRILARPAAHQRRALGKAVHQQNAMMRRVESVSRCDAGDKIDGDQMRALVQELENRVLSIRPHAAPSDRRSRAGG